MASMTILPKPQPMDATIEIEYVARMIYESMRFERADSTPEWQERGNSLAQEEARSRARVIAGLFQRQSEMAALCSAPVKVVWPLPFGHEWPWNRPGWCDDQGRCWLCLYPDDDWYIPTWKLARPSDYDMAAAIRGEGVLTLPHDSLPLPAPQIKVSPEP